jgi:hypothetical protein
MKKRTVSIAPIIVAFISITLINCGDDDGGVGPTPGGEEPKTGYAHFMPLNKGNKWTYEYLYSNENGPGASEEYELSVVDKFDNYEGFETYLVKCNWPTRIPAVDYIALGYDGDACYLYTCPWWEYVVEDDMPMQGWSQTGLFCYSKLQFNFVQDVSVPAGIFEDCKRLQMTRWDGNNMITFEEYYAEDVGLVYARRRYEKEPTDWSQYEYKLKCYKVTKPY